ncbi:hypothetical protein [Vulcanisaeta sp. JCM 14467]
MGCGGDGFVKDGYAAMNTTQVWQAIVWSLLYPGEDYVHVKAVNVNEGGLTITWRLRTNHDPLKGRVLNDVEKLGEEELLAFTFTAVLGDGYADVEELKINGRVYDEAVIAIAMSGEKFKRWEPLLEKLKGMGFNWGSVPINNSVINVRFYSGNAINLARAMINVLPPILKDILDALGFDKWVRIKRIAEMEVKFRRGEMRITVTGYGFTVHVQKGTVELEHWMKSDVEVDEVIKALKAVYGNGLQARVNTRKSGKYRVVTIPMHVFERYEDIKAQVVKVLCRKLERVKDERKKQIITKHLRRLTPTKGAVAVEHPNRESTQANPGNQNL